METKESVGSLLMQAMDAFNEETNEYNALCKEADDLERRNITLYSENDQLKTQLAKAKEENANLLARLQDLIKKTDAVQANAESHMVMLKQGKREQAQSQDKLDQAMITLAGYKQLGTPKKIREQIKNYKLKGESNQKTINSLKVDIKSYRKDLDTTNKLNKHLQAETAQDGITNLWSANGDHLMLFPAPLTMQINGKTEKQLTLLFMNGSGCGKLIGLDEDQSPIMCSMPKGGLKPKAATTKKAGEILRLFKKKNWRVTHDDLINIKEN